MIGIFTRWYLPLVLQLATMFVLSDAGALIELMVWKYVHEWRDWFIFTHNLIIMGL